MILSGIAFEGLLDLFSFRVQLCFVEYQTQRKPLSKLNFGQNFFLQYAQELQINKNERERMLKNTHDLQAHDLLHVKDVR